MTITTSPYKRAYVRNLSPSFSAAALSSQDNSLKPIDMKLAHKQHDRYTEVIKQLVPEVQTVTASETLADCCFIEDTCVTAGNVAVITRPGHENRRGEVVQVKEELSKDPRMIVYQMPEPCLLDGGDVLFTGTDFFVGLSKRTNQAGADFLSSVFNDKHDISPVHTINLQVEASTATLHLKCVISALTNDTLIVSDDVPGMYVQGEIERLVKEHYQRSNSGYEFIKVPDQISANILRFPDGKGGLLGVVVQKGFPQSAEVLVKAAKQTSPDCKVFELDMSEFILADGALTCCSLLLAE
ncbi:N(G),N(G)-dimethylarginine dimethylaminohydrolase 1 [Gryganskiella cystojenkinii]|nr:N(G),N(G)-dimethylarginine dimethylaminohydrolase 1 [Gryganskiella cystojenkinii]